MPSFASASVLPVLVGSQVGSGAGQGGAGGLSPWVPLTSAPASPLSGGGRYTVDFSGGMFDIALPAAPSFGTEITVKHIEGDVESEVTPPKITRNGNTIDDLAEDFDIDLNYQEVKFFYTNTGWRTQI